MTIMTKMIKIDVPKIKNFYYYISSKNSLDHLIDKDINHMISIKPFYTNIYCMVDSKRGVFYLTYFYKDKKWLINRKLIFLCFQDMLILILFI